MVTTRTRLPVDSLEPWEARKLQTYWDTLYRPDLYTRTGCTEADFHALRRGQMVEIPKIESIRRLFRELPDPQRIPRTCTFCGGEISVTDRLFTTAVACSTCRGIRHQSAIRARGPVPPKLPPTSSKEFSPCSKCGGARRVMDGVVFCTANRCPEATEILKRATVSPTAAAPLPNRKYRKGMQLR